MNTLPKIVNKLLLGALLTTLPSTTLLESRAETSEFSESADIRALVGTWEVTVTILDCNSGNVLRKFPSMLTFGADGTLTETTTGAPPTIRGPGHGTWRCSGLHTYEATFKAFLFSPTGVWTGTQTLTQQIQVDGSGNFQSQASIIFADVGGNITSTGCASATAVRMQ